MGAGDGEGSWRVINLFADGLLFFYFFFPSLFSLSVDRGEVERTKLITLHSSSSSLCLLIFILPRDQTGLCVCDHLTNKQRDTVTSYHALTFTINQAGNKQPRHFLAKYIPSQTTQVPNSETGNKQRDRQQTTRQATNNETGNS